MNEEGMQAVLVFLFIAGFFLLVVAGKSIRIIRPWEKGLIERLGRYQRTGDSGLNFVIPFFETMVKIDMREAVMDVPPQEVITSDNVVVTVDAVVYTEVTDPLKVKYNVMDFFLATIKLAQTNLRNLIGDMTLDAQSGANAGIACVLLATGGNGRAELEATGRPVLDSIDRLLTWEEL